MIITSEVSKQLIMLELTVPWEEHIEEANERKLIVTGTGGAVQGERMENLL